MIMKLTRAAAVGFTGFMNAWNLFRAVYGIAKPTERRTYEL